MQLAPSATGDVPYQKAWHMSFQATAWAAKVKAGSPAAKAVLMMLAQYMAPHEDEADGFLCGYPGQDILAEESEMSVRSVRDHLNALAARGLIQKRMRFRFGGVRTSDWYRIPVKADGSIHLFPAAEDPKATVEWPSAEPKTEDDHRQDPPPANLAAGEPTSDHRQPVAGYKGDDQLGELLPPTSVVVLEGQTTFDMDVTPTEKNESTAPADKKKTQRQKRPSLIDESFQASDDMVSWAKKNAPLVDGRFETAQFVDYWIARGDSKRDWVAAWRTWMRRAQKDAYARSTNKYANSGAQRAPHTPFQSPVDESVYDKAF